MCKEACEDSDVGIPTETDTKMRTHSFPSMFHLPLHNHTPVRMQTIYPYIYTIFYGSLFAKLANVFRLSGRPGRWLSGCLGSWPLQSKERADTRLQFWPWNCWPGQARVGPSVSGGLLRWPIPGPFPISGGINRLRICLASGPSGGI